ncbi:hypothetical protein J3458_020955 [Metarhizium acridum]|uniref:uncharacterized protein n=1 Tax=Metarhizium acridum TaxID=92637 RepID=UPI001C6CBC41|nr:hypothetical protein J3458_020955 [Metarhizium acridum]
MAPPPLPLPANYSAPPISERPFYPVTPSPIPCSVPSVQNMSSAGFNADVSDLPLPRKSRSRGPAVNNNGVRVDGQKQKRHATATTRQGRLHERLGAAGSPPRQATETQTVVTGKFTESRSLGVRITADGRDSRR